MPLDSLEDVRLFRQIVASGGLSAAARILHQNKNRLSQRLAALESAVGVRLADRTTRRFRLTEEGERFMLASEPLLQAADHALAATAGAESLGGRVRVAVRSAFHGFGLGEELGRLLLAEPGLRMQVAVVDEDADVHGQGFDLAVQVGTLKDSSLVAKPIGDSAFGLAAAPGYVRKCGLPRTPRELTDHECIRKLGAEPERSWPLVHRNGKRVNAPVAGRLECSDARLQAEILYAGFGIGVRPAAEVRRAVDAGTLVQVLPAWTFAPIRIWVVCPKGRLRLERVSRVVEVLTRLVASLA